jgi:hypothetical protein
MTDQGVVGIIEQARENTIQSRATQEVMRGGISLVNMLTRAGLSVSSWWSPARDKELRSFWRKPDHLAGAVYSMEAKMTAIPFHIIPREQSIREHAAQALDYTEALLYGAEFGEGWEAFYSKFVEDLLTCDNGAFAEIIGPGSPSGPLTGRPITVAHLDSARCQRTGNPEFPVLYQDSDGSLYKLHYTRVMFRAQMPSPISEMNGVGLCSVSRCINVSQTLLDILTFKQEKLGSRPHRSILIPRGGLDPQDVANAFALAEAEMDSQGLSRYSKVVLAGSSSMPEADIVVKELSSMPDGFDEETSITLGMATIALAFGVDARELFPAMSAGATRADALLQHLKQRGKGPGQILQMTESLFNQKFLPVHMRLEFDYQDDAQDRQIAEIRKIRSEKRVLDLSSGASNVRIVREQMLADGDITRGQFIRLELEDGRLEDGSSILALFYSKDKLLKKYLSVGVDNPLDTENNNMEEILRLIREKKMLAKSDYINETSREKKEEIFKAMLALDFLEREYVQPSTGVTQTESEKLEGEKPEIEKRTRTVDLTQPNQEELNSEDNLRAHPDDKVG